METKNKVTIIKKDGNVDEHVIEENNTVEIYSTDAGFLMVYILKHNEEKDIIIRKRVFVYPLQEIISYEVS